MGSEWQPIETLPKDSTVVLMWDADPSNMKIRIARADDLAVPGRAFWLEKVTHWQHLPDPPDAPK